MLYSKLETKHEWYFNNSSLNAGLTSGFNEVCGREVITGDRIVENTTT